MNEKKEKRTVIKIALPKNLKFKFKLLCTQKELTMSYVLEELITKWIQADCCIEGFILEPSREEELEELKGYISESLKIDFKILCVQKGITMRFALYNLINCWLETKTNR